MVSRPPQRNLGSGENWGKWVEDNISALQNDTSQQLQSIGRSINTINSGNRVTPFSRVYSNYTTDWTVSANGTKPICTVTVPWEIGKTSCTIMTVFRGFYGSFATPAIAMAYRATFATTVSSVGYTGRSGTAILGNMDTYNIIGVGSTNIMSVGDFTVDVSAINNSQYVPTSGVGNYMEIHVMASFS